MKSVKAAGYVSQNLSDDGCYAEQESHVVDGVFYAPASRFRVAAMNNNYGLVLLHVNPPDAGGEKVGLSMAMTPTVLRSAAAAMIGVAEQLEGHAAGLAKAALAKAARGE